MSLYSALYNGIGGMIAQANVIGSVSDNLANAQTVGFKRTDTEFEDLVSGTRQDTGYKGSGAKAIPYYKNDIQGSLLQSQVSTYTSIAGGGFFAVVSGNIGADGVLTPTGQQYYTRRGDFDLSRAVDTKDPVTGNVISSRGGYLVNGAGYYLLGYPVNEQTGTVGTTAAPMEIASLRSEPATTSQASFHANLPAGANPGDSFDPTTMKIYDSSGSPHDVVFTWSKTANVNEWNLNIKVPDDAGGLNRNLTFSFDGPPAGTPSAVANGTGTGGNFTTSAAVSGTDVSAAVNIDFGAGAQNVNFTFGQFNNGSGTTQFAATDVQVTSTDQNGLPPGAFKSLDIDPDGFVVLNYDSGLSRRVYQIPLASFASPNSLERANGGAFTTTQESGLATLETAGTGGTGKIVSNSLEGSNVDIAEEFTKMIASQRVYSANSKTVTTVDQMISDLVTLAR